MKRVIKASTDAAKSIEDAFMSASPTTQFTAAVHTILPMLQEAPIGTTMRYRGSNSWHTCYATFIKDGDDTWTYIYEVDGKECWRSTKSDRSAASEIGNSILDSKGLL